jgi:hypothetical protein
MCQSVDPSAVQARHTAPVKPVTIATATELLLLDTKSLNAIGSKMRISGTGKGGEGNRNLRQLESYS